MILLVTLLPFLVLCLLMIKYKRPAYIATPITLIITLLILVFVWGMKSEYMSAALLKSLLVSLEILAIVVSASILINILLKESISSVTRRLIDSVTHDRRIQAVLVGWFFVSFMEGVSGFGTPALLAAPLLVSFGFSPLASVVVALLGDSLSVIFGAVGTPILYGIIQGIGSNISTGSVLISHITQTSAAIAALIGWAIPIFISCVLVTIYKRPLREGLEIIPYMFMAWLCFFIPYLLSAFLAGPEFPSIVGPIIGGSVLIYLTKKKFLVPKTPWRFPHESADHSVVRLRDYIKKIDKNILPFAVVVLFLLIIKFLPGFQLSLPAIFGTSVSYDFIVTKSPSIALVVSLLFTWIFLKIDVSEIKASVKEAGSRVFKVGLALFSMVAVAQLFIYSGSNDIAFPSIPIYLTQQFSQLGNIWPLFAPFVGAFGAFVTGSATVSNLLFSSIHSEFGTAFGLSAVILLSLQTVGASLGNMIAVHNIVVASSVVKLDDNKEGTVIKYNIIPLLVMLLLAGLVGIVLQILLNR